MLQVIDAKSKRIIENQSCLAKGQLMLYLIRALLFFIPFKLHNQYIPEINTRPVLRLSLQMLRLSNRSNSEIVVWHLNYLVPVTLSLL